MPYNSTNFFPDESSDDEDSENLFRRNVSKRGSTATTTPSESNTTTNSPNVQEPKLKHQAEMEGRKSRNQHTSDMQTTTTATTAPQLLESSNNNMERTENNDAIDSAVSTTAPTTDSSHNMTASSSLSSNISQKSTPSLSPSASHSHQHQQQSNIPHQLASYEKFRNVLSHEQKMAILSSQDAVSSSIETSNGPPTEYSVPTLQYTQLRSLYWKYYFGMIVTTDGASDSTTEESNNTGTIDTKLQRQQMTLYGTLRAQYSNLIELHIEKPNRDLLQQDDSADASMSHPLSASQENPWQKIYKDEEIRKVIHQDLVRLFPEVPFFAKQYSPEDEASAEENGMNTASSSLSPIIASMQRILFIWSKENPDVSYRQGMHELLACFLYQMYRDIYLDDLDRFVEKLSSKKLKSTVEGAAQVRPKWTRFDQWDSVSSDAKLLSHLNELKQHLDPAFIEHDCYIMFSRFMFKMKQFFRWNRGKPMSTSTAKPASPMKHEDFPLTRMCSRIQNELLKKSDPELYKRLCDLCIEPQIYGLRWVRMLFGREFELHQVLDLWDVILVQVYRDFADLSIESDVKVEGGSDSGSATSDLVLPKQEQFHLLPPSIASKPDSIEDFNIVADVAVVMLMYLRDQLLTNVSTECMRQLMKYPQVKDPHIFVEKALEFQQTPQVAKLFPEKMKLPSNRPESGATTILPRSKKTQNPSKQKQTATQKQQNQASFSQNLISPHKSHRKMQANARVLQKRDKHIGRVLDHISHILQEEVIRKTDYLGFDDAVFISIAELKRIRDVIQGNAADNSVTENQEWIQEYYERNDPNHKPVARSAQGASSSNGNDKKKQGRPRSISQSRKTETSGSDRIKKKPRPLGAM